MTAEHQSQRTRIVVYATIIITLSARFRRCPPTGIHYLRNTNFIIIQNGPHILSCVVYMCVYHIIELRCSLCPTGTRTNHSHVVCSCCRCCVRCIRPETCPELQDFSKFQNFVRAMKLSECTRYVKVCFSPSHSWTLRTLNVQNSALPDCFMQFFRVNLDESINL